MPEYYWHPGYGEWRLREPQKPEGFLARIKRYFRRQWTKRRIG